MRSNSTINPLVRACLVVTMSFGSAGFLAACSSSSNSTASDAGTAPETGADGGATCAIDPPSGFTTVVAPSNDGRLGIDTTMVKDENDDPMIAHLWSGAAAFGSQVFFTRWDRCAGAFTAPIAVDTVSDVGTGQPARRIALAYDITTKKLAIAYELVGVLAAGSNPSNQIFLQTSTDKGATFTGKIHLSDQKPGDGEQATAPAVTISGGKIQVAYEQLNKDCCRDDSPNCGGCASVWYLEGDGTTFTRTQVKDSGGPVQPGPSVLSMAVDSSGKVGLAFLDEPATAYNRSAIYWQAGAANAVAVTTSNNIQNDDPSIALAFDGTKPRIATTLQADKSPDDTYDIQFVSSDDGVTWGTPVKLPRDGSDYTAWYQSIAIDSKGGAAVSGYVNGGSGDSTCGSPRIDRTGDLKAWTACGADKTKAYPNIGGKYVQSYFTKADKLTLAFNGTLGSDQAGVGVVLWRDQ